MRGSDSQDAIGTALLDLAPCSFTGPHGLGLSPHPWEGARAQVPSFPSEQTRAGREARLWPQTCPRSQLSQQAAEPGQESRSSHTLVSHASPSNTETLPPSATTAFSLPGDHGGEREGTQRFLTRSSLHPGRAWEGQFLKTPLSSEVTDFLRKL